MVNNDCSFTEGVNGTSWTVENFFDILIVPDTSKNKVATVSSGRCCFMDYPSIFRSPLLSLYFRPVINVDVMAGVYEMPGHGIPHIS